MRILPFGLVGTVAAVVHYSLAITLVSLLGCSPQIGNIGGYVVALLVSYAGQSRLTFPDATRQRHNFIRFVATSLCGFTLNFLSYAALLRWTSLDYRVSLVIVLTGVSAVTYLLLSRWVFGKRGIAV